MNNRQDPLEFRNHRSGKVEERARVPHGRARRQFLGLTRNRGVRGVGSKGHGLRRPSNRRGVMTPLGNAPQGPKRDTPFQGSCEPGSTVHEVRSDYPTFAGPKDARWVVAGFIWENIGIGTWWVAPRLADKGKFDVNCDRVLPLKMSVHRCLASTARLHRGSHHHAYRLDLSYSSLHSTPRRFLATHRETPASSLLSSSLDRAASREGLSHNARLDSLGPFPLGIGPNPAYQTKQKPWKQLSTKGKVARTTARTTNLTVILFGGAFTCVLAYALATELFAKNSPTKLYEDACQKITASPEVRHSKR